MITNLFDLLKDLNNLEYTEKYNILICQNINIDGNVFSISKADLNSLKLIYSISTVEAISKEGMNISLEFIDGGTINVYLKRILKKHGFLPSPKVMNGLHQPDFVIESDYVEHFKRLSQARERFITINRGDKEKAEKLYDAEIEAILLKRLVNLFERPLTKPIKDYLVDRNQVDIKPIRKREIL